MAKSTGKFLTYEQKKQAEDLFREHMVERELEPGAYQWENGWNDMVVMETIGAHTPTQVAAFRTELGFKLQNRTPRGEGNPSKVDLVNNKVDDVAERCIILEERLERAFKTMTELQRRILKLEAKDAGEAQKVLIPQPWNTDPAA